METKPRLRSALRIHRPLVQPPRSHGWEAPNHYLNNPGEIPGFLSEEIEFINGNVDFTALKFRFSIDDYFVYAFSRWILKIPRPPNPWVWFSSFDLERFRKFRESHAPEKRLLEQRRWARLGPSYQHSWFELNDRERFVVKMSEETFLECFVPDQSRSSYSSVLSSTESSVPLRPLMIRIPSGFPGGGSFSDGGSS